MKKKYIITVVIAIALVSIICIIVLNARQKKSYSDYTDGVSENQYHGADTYDENYINNNTSATGSLTFVGENQLVVEYIDESGMLYYLNKETGEITQVNIVGEGDEGLEE